MGFTEIITVVFIIMKLTGHIDWSWWLVLAPTWIGLIIALTVLGIILLTGRRHGPVFFGGRRR